MSASASVIGPAAIFGSRLKRCKTDGTPKPKRHAVTSESAMLPPIAAAARESCRQIITIAATMIPQPRPIRTAVINSRRSAVAKHRDLRRGAAPPQRRADLRCCVHRHLDCADRWSWLRAGRRFCGAARVRCHRGQRSQTIVDFDARSARRGPVA